MKRKDSPARSQDEIENQKPLEPRERHRGVDVSPQGQFGIQASTGGYFGHVQKASFLASSLYADPTMQADIHNLFHNALLTLTWALLSGPSSSSAGCSCASSLPSVIGRASAMFSSVLAGADVRKMSMRTSSGLSSLRGGASRSGTSRCP